MSENAMSDYEKTRLLSGPATDRGKERNGKCCIPSTRARVICLSVVFIVAASPTLILTTLFALKLNPHTRTATAQCINGTSSVKVQTRSGSFSLLGNISDPMCSEPVAQVSLSSKDSSLEIHQIFCKDMDVLPFQAGPINFSDVLLTNEPKPVFNENFSPHNFFMDGSIQVTLTNVTTNRSSTTVEACYFTNNNDYSRFLIAGVDWRNYTTGAYCNSTVITVDNGLNYEVLLKISKPSFVFLGITSTTAVHIDQMEVSAFGHNISSFGTDSAKVCKLNGGDMKCNFSLKFDHEDQDICVVAYEDDNPDGSYDYSNLTLTLPTSPEKSTKQYKIFGFISLGTSALTLVILFVIVTVTIVLKWIQKPWPCNCTQTRSRNDASLEERASHFDITSTGHVRSTVTADNPTINTEPNASTGTEAAPRQATQDDAGYLVVVSSSTKADKTIDPASSPISEHSPIQETGNDLSELPSNPIVKPMIPIEEGAQSLSPNMDDSKSSESNSDSRFEKAVAEMSTQQPPEQ